MFMDRAEAQIILNGHHCQKGSYSNPPMPIALPGLEILAGVFKLSSLPLSIYYVIPL